MKKVHLVVMIALTLLVAFTRSNGQERQAKKQMKPVLLVIDIQNEYLPLIPEDEKKLELRMINGAIWLFRQHDLPVIRVYHTNPQYGPDPNTEAFEFPSSVIIKPEDPKIVKNYPSAFKKTELEKLLREKECNTLFLCGLSAVGCVMATYHSGLDLDYNVFMIKDAIMSHNSAYTDFVEEILNTVNFTTLQFILEYTQ